MMPPLRRILPARSFRGLATLALASTFAAGPAAAQSDPSTGQGERPPVDRQGTWPSPTAADWKKPCLITWQRTWEDAVAVARQTGRPILICVNMDGEIASEHYAGKRYRDPKIASLYEPYVCVIASVYRHNPRDHDDEGHRIECPRFGTVTCGEHIAIEPVLYEKYFDGRRIAPRHIMIELDGSETYDVFYTWDTESVFNQVVAGIAERGDVPITVVRSDRPIVERVASRNVRDREAVEEAYRNGDADLRRRLLEAAADHPDVASPDLLRQAIFGFDSAMSALARDTLAKTASADAVDLIAESLNVPMDETERKKLVGALERIGNTSSSPRARWLSVINRGLSVESEAVDTTKWSAALQGAEYPALEDTPHTDWSELATRLAEKQQPDATGTPQQPQRSAGEWLDLAETQLSFALEAGGAFGIFSQSGELLTADPATARRLSRSHLVEAREAVLEARNTGADGWRVSSILALSAYYLGETEKAYELSETATKELPPGATDWSSMAVLTIFAEGRFQAIKKAVADKQDWPPQWLTDVHSAYSVLLRHPLGTASQVVWHYDFLEWLGAQRYASRVLRLGLERFPASPALHERFRASVLANRGIDELEARYEAMLEAEDAAPSLEWFAGLASFLAAEQHRRDGDTEKGNAAYGRVIDHYERAIAADAELKETSDHYIALALAGRARVAIDTDDLASGLKDILASFDRRREAAGVLDGLNITPAATAQLLLSRLQEAGRTEDAATVRAALASLDPEQLVEPFEEKQ